MSLLPMLFSDWWQELDRPHRLWDQHFGTILDPEDLLSELDLLGTEIVPYRPRRRTRRHHPFFKGSGRRQGRGASTVLPDKNKFQVTLDVSQFSLEEINVKVVGQNVVVEAKHNEKEDEHGWVSRQFVRRYIVPSLCDIDKVESQLSSDGVLTITAPRKEHLKSETNERIVKIQYTGKQALINSDEKPNDISESQEEQETSQRGGQQQQQQPQQQPQRGRKGIVKAG